MSDFDKPLTVKDHLLIINSLYAVKRFGGWNDKLQGKLDIVSTLRKTFETMWHRPEYQEKAKRLVEDATRLLNEGKIPECLVILEQIQELYVLNKMHDNLD